MQQQLVYGAIISLKNLYHEDGGYLCIGGKANAIEALSNWPVNQLVFTCVSPYEVSGKGLWKILSASGKSEGQPVHFGDNIYLSSMVQGGGYLATCGYISGIYAADKNFYKNIDEDLGVFTIDSNTNYGNPATWQLVPAGNNKTGDPVQTEDAVQLLNLYPAPVNGGYLDIYGHKNTVPAFSRYDCEHLVFTSVSNTRDDKSGTWQILAEEERMLMLDKGAYAVAGNIPGYDLSGGNFTVNMMLSHASPGTVISGPSFVVEVETEGRIMFTIYGRADKNYKALYVSSSATGLLNSMQCHVLTCINPEGTDPCILLDGKDITEAITESRNQVVGISGSPMLLGTEDARTSYSGGIMNLSVWSRILDGPDAMLKGSGILNPDDDGLVGFWPLNTSFSDISRNKNAWIPQEQALFRFMPCNDCIYIAEDFGARFLKIEGPLYGKGTITQSVYVHPDAPSLLASIIDDSGECRFPDGLVLKITDPTGKIYGAEELRGEAAFAATRQSGGKNSLFGLVVNQPVAGTWTVEISGVPDRYFLCTVQVFPYALANWTLGNTAASVMGVGSRYARGRNAETAGFWSKIGWGLIAVAAVVGIAAVVAGPGAVVAAVGLAGIGVMKATAVVVAGTSALLLVGVNMIGNDPAPVSSDLMHTTVTIGEQLGYSNSPVPPLNNINLNTGLFFPPNLSEGPSSYGIKGVKKNIRARMVFVEFADVKFRSNEKPASIYASIADPVRQFFLEQSYGNTTVTIECFDTVRTLPDPRAQYESGDSLDGNFYTGVQDLFTNLDWVNFDLVYIIAAGTSEKMTAWWVPVILTMGYPEQKEIYPVVFPNATYYLPQPDLPDMPAIIGIHETGHALGLPDLYKYKSADSTARAGCWDFMSDNYHAKNLLGWHRHKLEWLGDKRKFYMDKTLSIRTELKLVPLNATEGVAMIVLRDFPEYRAGVTPSGDAFSIEPSRVIVIEVALPTKKNVSPRGVLIYTVDGRISTRDAAVEVLHPPGISDVNQAVWNEGSGTYAGNFFTVKVVRQETDGWVVEIN